TKSNSRSFRDKLRHCNFREERDRYPIREELIDDWLLEVPRFIWLSLEMTKLDLHKLRRDRFRQGIYCAVRCDKGARNVNPKLLFPIFLRHRFARFRATHVIGI